MKTGYDKEQVYDEQISPLMKQIIAICKEHELTMISSFYLASEDMRDEGDVVCTTRLLYEGNTPDQYIRFNDDLYSKPLTMAMTITSIPVEE